MIVEPEVKEAALAWVPNAMRFLDRTSETPLDPTAERADEAPEAEDEAATDGAATDEVAPIADEELGESVAA